MLSVENRIAADRMWRDPAMRALFEREVSLSSGDDGYDARFIEWAEDVIVRRERCPHSGLSGPGGGCNYPKCIATCHGRLR